MSVYSRDNVWFKLITPQHFCPLCEPNVALLANLMEIVFDMEFTTQKGKKCLKSSKNLQCAAMLWIWL